MLDIFSGKQEFFTTTAGVLLAVFFVSFFGLMASDPEQRDRLAADKVGKRANLLLVPLALAAVLAPSPYNAWALVVVLLAAIVLTRAQHARLAHTGASRSFLRRLTAVSSIALLAGLSYGASLLAAG